MSWIEDTIRVLTRTPNGVGEGINLRLAVKECVFTCTG